MSYTNERKTDAHFFFWHSSCPLSNWSNHAFSWREQSFPNAEVALMWAKAKLFNDHVSIEKLENTSDPKEAKSIGRQVSNFNDQVWNQHRFNIMKSILLAKFSQNREARNYLLNLSNLQLVEASPYDKIWGIGLQANDDRVLNTSQWEGLNLLGQALTEVKTYLFKVIQFISSEVFITEDGQPMDLSRPYTEGKVSVVSIPHDLYWEYFGCYSSKDNNEGKLAERFPSLFKSESMANLTNSSWRYDDVRYELIKDLLSQWLYNYQSPRWNDDGEMVFLEVTAIEESERNQKPYVIMDDLS